MQNALLEHSAILSTLIKLPFVFKNFNLSGGLSGCLRQVLLYVHSELIVHVIDCVVHIYHIYLDKMDFSIYVLLTDVPVKREGSVSSW